MICMPRSGVEKGQLSRSKAIDKSLAKDKQVLKSQVQLLLLGRPRSGKTTLVKQLRLKNGDTFSQEETEASKMILLENLTDAMRTLLCLRHETDSELPWSSDSVEDDALALCSCSLSLLVSEQGWEGVTTLLVRLWKEEAVQKIWKLSSAMPGMDCLPRFLDDPEVLCDKKYLPRPTDIVYIYQSTHGVHDSAVQGEAAFRLVEIGGRSLTTPKLLYYFDNVTAVIFMASCCDVEHTAQQEQGTSAAAASEFQQTCDFFAMVANDKSLQKLPIILLITKLDLLMEKSKRIDLKTFFQDFKGDPQEAKDVQKHVLGVFRALCGPRPFYHHFLDCTDLASVEQVFVEMKRDIRDSLLRKLLPQ